MDFNRYLDERMATLSNMIINQAQDFEQILGFRYMLGEIEALKGMVNGPLLEDAQLSAVYGEREDGGEDESGSDAAFC